MEDKSKTLTWEWEDGETGLIRTIKIPMPDLDRDYDPSELREIILDGKVRLDNVEMPDWIEIIPPRKPNGRDMKARSKSRENQPKETINS